MVDEINVILSLHVNYLLFPLSLRPSVPISDEELLRISAQNKGFRIERIGWDQLTIHPPLGGIASQQHLLAGVALLNWAESAGGLALGTNVGVSCAGGSVLSPDAAWISSPRWSSLSRQQRDGFLPFCPEFLMEIRSNTEDRQVLEAKMQTWLDNGVQLAWLVDPYEREVIIYTQDASPDRLANPEEVHGAGPVAGFVLSTAHVWAIE